METIVRVASAGDLICWWDSISTWKLLPPLFFSFLQSPVLRDGNYTGPCGGYYYAYLLHGLRCTACMHYASCPSALS